MLVGPFKSRCGSVEGTLQADRGRKPLDLRMMLQLQPTSVDSVKQWLHQTFSMHGPVDEVRVPRLQCNWDGGIAFVRFTSSRSAHKALRHLDGSPSCILGCNMYIDFAEETPLWRGPGIPPGSASQK